MRQQMRAEGAVKVLVPIRLVAIYPEFIVAEVQGVEHRVKVGEDLIVTARADWTAP